MPRKPPSKIEFDDDDYRAAEEVVAIEEQLKRCSDPKEIEFDDNDYQAAEDVVAIEQHLAAVEEQLKRCSDPIERERLEKGSERLIKEHTREGRKITPAARAASMPIHRDILKAAQERLLKVALKLLSKEQGQLLKTALEPLRNGPIKLTKEQKQLIETAQIPLQDKQEQLHVNVEQLTGELDAQRKLDRKYGSGDVRSLDVRQVSNVLKKGGFARKAGRPPKV